MPARKRAAWKAAAAEAGRPVSRTLVPELTLDASSVR
jgi:hypothetical protein